MEKEMLLDRINEIAKSYNWINEDGGIEIFCDYRDELADCTIKKIMKSENLREAFDELMSEWASDYAAEYGEPELINEIKNDLSAEALECFEEYEEEVLEYIRENYYFYYPEKHFNKNVHVNIMVDTGDMNYDFTCNNILNWYGRNGYGCGGDIDDNSSILWLAKTQDKEKELRRACKRQYRNNGNYTDRKKESDKFIESVIQELENLPSHMAGLTFLVSMPLFDLFKLHDIINTEKELNKSYIAEERKGTSYITLGKETMCGLFDCWHGGGSVLEIELDKDVKLPIKYIFDAWVDGTKPYGWDIDEVYGLVSSAWRKTLKEICCIESEVI